jgi:hypothetical protein
MNEDRDHRVMDRTGNVLSIYLGGELKTQWLKFCEVRGTSSSEAMRSVVRKLTSRPVEPQTFQVLHEQPDCERRRIEIRLTASEYACLEKVARLSGNSPNSWLVNMARANLARAPQLGSYELQVLGKSNSNLLAIGRNLNQIARWMNGNQGSAPPEIERIDGIYRHIVSHTEEVTAVMRANLDRWILK